MVQLFFEKNAAEVPGREALVAVRRQRNLCAVLLAHGEKGEKIDRFSRESEHDRFPWLPLLYW